MQRDNRPLTYDEKKAAEAAFKGLPFDPIWSDAALTVYLGISSVMENKPQKSLPRRFSYADDSVRYAHCSRIRGDITN